ncbi:hypothetical protein PFISCL1PPCAC_24365, partial [Pristionchus fissidentatus]
DEISTHFTLRLPTHIFYDTEGVEYNVADPSNILVRGVKDDLPQSVTAGGDYGTPDPRLMSNCIVWRRNVYCFCDGQLWILSLETFIWTYPLVYDHITVVWIPSNTDDLLSFLDEERGIVELTRIRPSIAEPMSITSTEYWL